MSSNFLGIDTSNYRTSVAIYNNDCIENINKLLPVKSGEIGLRQSDAVFLHIKEIDKLMTKLSDKKKDIKAVGVSVSPRPRDDSYMPCFLVGKAVANCIAQVNNVPCYEFSHQEGHLMSAIIGSGNFELLKQKFYFWHISGGTTECHIAEYKDGRFNLSEVSKSLDLFAGQAIDRVGKMLGLDFPAGMELEKLASKCDIKFKDKAAFKEENFCLSGIENKCKDMLEKQENEYIAKYLLDFILETLIKANDNLINKYGDMPILLAGGVMSNSYIKSQLNSLFNIYSCQPNLASDNAVGIAYLANLRSENL